MSFTGTFAHDNDVQLFTFVVGAPSTVTLRAWSYAGGVNAAGATIARGGFDTILAVFDSSGNRIGQNDDGGCGLVAADSVSGRCWDTYLGISLAAGTYRVSVMEYDNFSIGTNLSDGFIHGANTGLDFTGPLTGHPGEQFWDVADTHRDNHWAFDILNVESARQEDNTIPEPATLLLLGSGLAGMLIRRKRPA
jgi:hypothetical protein